MDSISIQLNSDRANGDAHPSIPHLFYFAGQAVNGDPSKYLGTISGFVTKEVSKLILAASDMHAILDELEATFDKEIYPEQVKEDFDAPDDREYTVTITAKQWRALGRALGKIQRTE
jgi:hypothetical protein